MSKNVIRDAEFYEDLVAANTLDEIDRLVEAGVLGRELCPYPDYWHWPILKKDELPKKFHIWIELGEVRLY